MEAAVVERVVAAMAAATVVAAMAAGHTCSRS